MAMSNARGPGRTSPLLDVRDLRVEFRVPGVIGAGSSRAVRAVDGVSLSIERGTTLGLVGESGCGKTTVGRAILRLTEAAGGQVVFDGVDVLSAPRGVLRRLRRQMQVVFQDTSGSLNPRLTIGQTLAEPLILHRMVRRNEVGDRVRDLLERVGLRGADADRYPHELSGGQRQRVAIARAVALEPRLIVWDEPVSALDVSIQAAILNLLRDLQREMQLAGLFIAHNLAVVRHVSDRVAVMYLGRIVETADANSVYGAPAHPYTMALMTSVPGRNDEAAEHRIVLRGDVPSPIDRPEGCALHPRCPFATEKCHQAAPLLEHHPGLSPGHLAACHHAGTVAPVSAARPV
jgi:oligopeptide/dipeptide ABC transporter ATP-binding protein